MNAAKKAYIRSHMETSRVPYQKPRARKKYSTDCVSAKANANMDREDCVTALSSSEIYRAKTDFSIPRGDCADCGDGFGGDKKRS